MLIEAQNIADALAKVLAAAITDYEANVGCDGIPVKDVGFITDAVWDEDGDEVEITIEPGDRTWVIRPQEVAEVPSGRRAAGPGRPSWSQLKG